MNDDSMKHLYPGCRVRLLKQINAQGFRRSYDTPPNITVYQAGMTGTVTNSQLRDGKIRYTVQFDEDGHPAGCGNIPENSLDRAAATDRSTIPAARVSNERVGEDLRKAWALIHAHPGGPVPEHLSTLEHFVWNVEHNTEVVLVDGHYLLRWTKDPWWVNDPR